MYHTLPSHKRYEMVK